jgi:hypothetical protein
MPLQRTLARISRKVGLRGALALAIILAAAMLVTKLFVMAALVVMAFILTMLVRTFHLRMLGLELATFLTILSGYLYGPEAGMIVGLVSILFHLIGGGYSFGLFYFCIVPTYVLIGLLAGMWSSQPITSLGIYLVLLLNGINLGFTLLFTPGGLVRHVPFALTDILFNVMLFTLVAPALVAILA